MRLQDDPRQKFAVTGDAQDAELQTARFIARQQKQRQLQAIVDFTIGLQAIPGLTQWIAHMRSPV